MFRSKLWLAAWSALCTVSLLQPHCKTVCGVIPCYVLHRSMVLYRPVLAVLHASPAAGRHAVRLVLSALPLADVL
jgi:hypothetical protein